MEKKRIIIAGIGIFSLLAFILLLQFGNQEVMPEESIKEVIQIESMLQTQGIKSTTSFYPRFKHATVEFYYQYDDCAMTMDQVLLQFPAFTLTTQEKRSNPDEKIRDSITQAQLPILLIKGSADIFDLRGNYVSSNDRYEYVINGLSACSQRLLQHSLCSASFDQPGFCQNISYQRQVEAISSLQEDVLCYESCITDIVIDGVLVTQYRQGPPCDPKPGYREGLTQMVVRACSDSSVCGEQTDDVACCRKGQCVFQGQCMETFSTTDVNLDGQPETCMYLNGTSLWVDPDVSQNLCTISQNSWHDCVESSCSFGIDTADSRENGFCCGDDSDEENAMCAGSICKTQSRFGEVCCAQDSCSYNEECYAQGCHTLKLETQEIVTAYCEKGFWKDLDEEYCVQCLGNDRWSGLVCCGDDHEEGSHPTRFTYTTDGATNVVFYDFCTNDKSSCVMPNTQSEFQFKTGE